MTKGKDLVLLINDGPTPDGAVPIVHRHKLPYGPFCPARLEAILKVALLEHHSAAIASAKSGRIVAAAIGTNIQINCK